MPPMPACPTCPCYLPLNTFQGCLACIFDCVVQRVRTSICPCRPRTGNCHMFADQPPHIGTRPLSLLHRHEAAAHSASIWFSADCISTILQLELDTTRDCHSNQHPTSTTPLFRTVADPRHSMPDSVARTYVAARHLECSSCDDHSNLRGLN